MRTSSEKLIDLWGQWWAIFDVKNGPTTRAENGGGQRRPRLQSVGELWMSSEDVGGSGGSGKAKL